MGYCPFSVLSHDTVDCIVTQARRGSLGQERHGHDTTLRQGEERPRHGQERLRYDRPTRKGKQRAREGLAAEGLCRDTNGRIVTGTWLSRWVVLRYRRDTAGGCAAIRRRERTGARACARRYGCPSLLYGWAKPATQRNVRAGWAGCAPGALNQFWTQCTVSESLFGTLFMSTVHKFFLNKIKSNQMK